MSRADRRARRLARIWVTFVLVVGGFCLSPGVQSVLQAQLAITEVMAYSYDPDFIRTEFWELTNFGTNSLNLEGFGFKTFERNTSPIRYPFSSLIIHPRESIIFLHADPRQSSVTNVARFREWWGNANLPPNLQVRTYDSPSFDGEFGDAIWLYDASSNLVDYVSFRDARIGHSFINDSETGILNDFSIKGFSGSFMAVHGDDCGSPGTAPEPCPLRLLRGPSSASADAGSTVTFEVIAVGLPQPRYQWKLRDRDIKGATNSTLTLANVQRKENGGEYCVNIWNGLSNILSHSVLLDINMDPTPSGIVVPPSDVSVFPGQTAEFSVQARGYPLPSYQWQSNGVSLSGATNPVLRVLVPEVAPTMSGATYAVRVANQFGETNASARLHVVKRPHIEFTEVMPKPIYDGPVRHFNWFELTNFDTNAVDLCGYRVSDTTNNAFVISNSLVLQPAESVIFVERMSPDEFRHWWGETDLPPRLQVRTFRGFSISEIGETLFLWNGSACEWWDTVAATSTYGAVGGLSMVCDVSAGDGNGYCRTNSFLWRDGAFLAASTGFEARDVGSPGYVTNPPPRILAIEKTADQVVLRCHVRPQGRYRLGYASKLPCCRWRSLGTYFPSEPILRIADPEATSRAETYYRLEEEQEE